jgi:hypothetical protein
MTENGLQRVDSRSLQPVLGQDLNLVPPKGEFYSCVSPPGINYHAFRHPLAATLLNLYCHTYNIVECKRGGFGGVVVSVLTTGLTSREFEPGQVDGFLRAIKSAAHLPSDGK